MLNVYLPDVYIFSGHWHFFLQIYQICICLITWANVEQYTRCMASPGWGLRGQFLLLDIFFSTVKALFTCCISCPCFDRCHHSSFAVTPVKYECDSKNQNECDSNNLTSTFIWFKNFCDEKINEWRFSISNSHPVSSEIILLLKSNPLCIINCLLVRQTVTNCLSNQ